MAKKALVSTKEPRGKDNSGYRVAEVVNVEDVFEVHSNLQWKDCSDDIVADHYWWDPTTSTYKKTPEGVLRSTAGELAVDEQGKPTEYYVWNWDTETWHKETL